MTMNTQLSLLTRGEPAEKTINAQPATAKRLPPLDHVRRRVTVTIDNGSRHATLRFAAWAPGGRQGSGYDAPVMFFVDTLDRDRVARVKVYHGAGGLRSYRFYGLADVDPALLYAAHLCFLHLTGTDTTRVAWHDLNGVHRQPTDRYTLRPMSECLRCGRKLTAPTSIDLALGPECRRQQGVVASAHTRPV